jgi:ApbE superfamily uncharacterized protein (UPF0280 family)
MRQQRGRLGDGRLHFNDGPIDLIIEAFGESGEIEKAYAAAWRRFASVLDELCEELPALRAEAVQGAALPTGRVARRMFAAVAPFASEAFITPMAAVAGSVAEEILAAMTEAATLGRAYVNNGGDIALHLTAGERFRIGMIDRPDQPGAFGSADIDGASGVRGVATSGWRGRSFSLGIADAVTVLAARACQADAAATIIANAVDLPGHPAIRRAPARDFDPQSDLGERLVTREVGPLDAEAIEAALARGLRKTERLRERGLIVAAALHLQGETRTTLLPASRGEGGMHALPRPACGERVGVRGGANVRREAVGRTEPSIFVNPPSFESPANVSAAPHPALRATLSPLRGARGCVGLTNPV